MKLSALLKEAGLAYTLHADPEINGICANSEMASPGVLFVALAGLHVDGAAYVKDARARGAVFVIAERRVTELPCLVVENAREVYARLQDAFYGHPAADMTLIGVTGTNGKTSVSRMLFDILRAAGHCVGIIGTVGCFVGDVELVAKNSDALANMTTPDPSELYAVLAQMRLMGVTHLVMEVTSHALYFSKVAPLCFALGIFTNLTPDHLDMHGSMERYYAEKKKLFSACDAAVISTSTEYGVRLAGELNIPLLRVTEGETLLDVIYRGVFGVSFSLLRQGEKLPFSLPVPGYFSVENGALAAMSALQLGVDACVIEQALAGFRGVPGRLERVDGVPLGMSVFLDYAHTPDALEKLLLSVRRFAAPGQRLLLLFGCGGDRDRTKRAEMGRVGSRLSDLLILTSDNCRTEDPMRILQDILKGVDKERPFVVIPERREAIAYAVETARIGDIILLAGKGHETYEIRGRERLPFSERELVQAFFKKKGEAYGANTTM